MLFFGEHYRQASAPLSPRLQKVPGVYSALLPVGMGRGDERRRASTVYARERLLSRLHLGGWEGEQNCYEMGKQATLAI